MIRAHPPPRRRPSRTRPGGSTASPTRHASSRSPAGSSSSAPRWRCSGSSCRGRGSSSERARIGGYFDGWGLASPTHLFVVRRPARGPCPGHPSRTRPGLDPVGDLRVGDGRAAHRTCLAVPHRPARRRRRPDDDDARWRRPADRWRVALWATRHVRPNHSSEGTAAERRLRTAPATLRRARQTEPEPTARRAEPTEALTQAHGYDPPIDR